MRPSQHDLIKHPQAAQDFNDRTRELIHDLKEDLRDIPDPGHKLAYFDFFIKSRCRNTLADLAACLLMSRGATRYSEQDIQAAIAEIETEGIITHTKRLKAEGGDPGLMALDAILTEYERIEHLAGNRESGKEYRLTFNKKMKADLEKIIGAGHAQWNEGKADFKNRLLLIALVQYWRGVHFDSPELHDGNIKYRIMSDNFLVNGEKPKIENYTVETQFEREKDLLNEELKKILFPRKKF
jgi:hypothetical protein